MLYVGDRKSCLALVPQAPLLTSAKSCLALQKMIRLDLTVKLAATPPQVLTLELYAAGTQTLLLCDRRRNIEEVVVAIMEILRLKETLALCGPSRR
jgi:hypothetical protein